MLAPLADVMQRRFARLAWTLAALAASVLVVRAFVGDVYHVDSASMEPTILGAEDGGEWVFVRYDRSLPSRGEIVVLLRRGESEAAVKRVAGLPGESVQISRGDVLVRSQRLAKDAPRPPLVPLFDSRVESVSDRFKMGSAILNPWSESGGAWKVDARAIEPGADGGLALLRDEIDDGYLGPRGERVLGVEQANDAQIELELRITSAAGAARLALVEEGDRFEARLEPLPNGRARVALSRRNTTGVEALGQSEIDLRLDTWTAARFANVDNHLALWLDGRRVVEATYKENVPHPHDLAQEGKTFGWRAAFGGEAGEFTFRSIRVARDFVYTQRGGIGTRAPIELGPDELFVLGDNSASSRDSREWGPVKQNEIVGRAVSIVWPPSRWRALSGAVAPPAGPSRD